VRKEFSNIISRIGKEDDKIIFLSGDLGYKALEEVQEALKDRFINMGVAEQNMISVAAGLAYEGYRVFCYSIAPFIVYRCLEQTRNDVCFHHLPVCLVGNGGGYGYGIMGATHHALEDIACLSSLPDMTCYVPAFTQDLEFALTDILEKKGPAYLRLGLGKSNPEPRGKMSFFYKATHSDAPALTILATGPIINNVIEAILKYSLKGRFDLFAVAKFPYEEFPEEFLKSIGKSRKLLVVEEHVKSGGLAQKVAEDILALGIGLDYYKSLCALHYPNKLYGNQEYHQKISGVDTESIALILGKFN
jgi:transketolase